MSEPNFVDLIVLHHPHHVVARFGERDPLDPVDDLIDRFTAWVTVFLEPFPGATGTGIVGDESQDIGSVEIVDMFAKIMRSKGGVVARVSGQFGLGVLYSVLAGHLLGRAGQQLQQAAGIGFGNRGLVKGAFLAGDGIGKGLAGSGNIGA